MDPYALLFADFLKTNDPYLWVISPLVMLDFNQDQLLSEFENHSADFISLDLRTYADDPYWNWWSSLSAPENVTLDEEDMFACFLALMRISRQAAEVIVNGLQQGWKGHAEALIPTLIHSAGLRLEDLGNDGPFTPEERRGLWYDKETVDWRGPVRYKPGKIHHPVPPQTRALASQRLDISPVPAPPKILYVSPAGAQARELLPDVLASFLGSGCDCLLLQYDDAEFDLPEQVKVIRERGYKWQLALKHLHPDQLSEYDYIFFWDDDMGTAGFDARTFVEIMRLNRLSMAQPAITSPHGLSHAITRYRPSPPPLRQPDGESFRPIVGRLTNFVEVMAPVFTRDAWREFYSYLNPDNRSGWGYDYVPLGRKGIIDLMPVEHTRAVQSINGASEAELRDILENQGLFRYQHVEMGWLLGHPSKFAFSQYASDVD